MTAKTFVALEIDQLRSENATLKKKIKALEELNQLNKSLIAEYEKLFPIKRLKT